MRAGRVAAVMGVMIAVAARAAPAPVALDPNAFPSSGPLVLTSGAYTINTSGPNGKPSLMLGKTVLATGSVVGQTSGSLWTLGVLDFDSISVAYGASITVTGKYALALLSRGDVTLNGPLDGSGLGGSGTLGGRGGPGGFAGGAGAPPNGSALGGRGPGGGKPTFGGTAGFGAGGAYGGPSAGDLFNDPQYGGKVYGNLHKVLSAGSGGSGSGSAFGLPGGGGGGGGGGIELVSLTQITLFTADQAANGGVVANGGTGANNGGGGSGGGILIAAPTIELGNGGGAVIEAGAGDWDGGGGRVLLLNGKDGLLCNGQACTSDQLNQLITTTVSGHYYSAGVVEYGALTGYREPPAARGGAR